MNRKDTKMMLKVKGLLWLEVRPSIRYVEWNCLRDMQMWSKRYNDGESVTPSSEYI